MTDLSPAAQTVLDAFRTSHTGQGCLAAALRSAANDWRIDSEHIYGVEYIRTTTLEKIASELEAHQ